MGHIHNSTYTKSHLHVHQSQYPYQFTAHDCQLCIGLLLLYCAINMNNTRWLYCVEWHKTLFARSGPLSMHKPYSFCIRQCLVSRACDWVMSALSAALHIFSFQLRLLFSHLSVARQHQAAPALRRTIGFNTQYRTSDVAKTLGRYTFPVLYVSCVSQGNNFELILTVIMETRHPDEPRRGSVW